MNISVQKGRMLVKKKKDLRGKAEVLHPAAALPYILVYLYKCSIEKIPVSTKQR